jgi:hypothetical protein
MPSRPRTSATGQGDAAPADEPMLPTGVTGAAPPAAPGAAGAPIPGEGSIIAAGVAPDVRPAAAAPAALAAPGRIRRRPGGGACRCHASRGHSCIRMVVGAVAMLGLSVLLAGARRTAGLGHTALRELQKGRHSIGVSRGCRGGQGGAFCDEGHGVNGLSR